MNSLAVAIHERSSKTSELACFVDQITPSAHNQPQLGDRRLTIPQPEDAAAQGTALGDGTDGGKTVAAGIGNPTEVCVVYLREKIAQLIGLVDAIEQRAEFVRSYMLKDSLRGTKKLKRAKLYEQASNYSGL